ncbi:MAG: S49 family peptidase, partial [Pseudomonadales bacterium]
MSSEKPGLWARLNRGLEGLRRSLANVGFVLIVVLVALGLSQGDGTPPVPEGGALVVTLDGPLVDAPPSPDPLAALFDEGGVEPLVLAEVLRALKAVESDAALRGVVLDLDAFPGAGFATLERLGSALAALRAAGKTVVTHSEGLSQAAYYLASFSDELYLDPEGALWLRGLASEPLYFGAALDRLKVSVEVLRAGRYKAAVEPLLRNDMSPEAREADQALIDSLW